MTEYCVQRRFDDKCGKWMFANERTFNRKSEAKKHLAYLTEEFKTQKAVLPEGFRVEYSEFRIAKREVGRWQGV